MELIVTGINKVFQSSDGEPSFDLEVPILSLPLGGLTYLVGHNGSGKSVFLKLLSGEMQPTKGELKIECQNEKYSPTELVVAVVRQKAEENLCDDLTVEENLLLRLQAKTISEKLFPKTYLSQKVIGALDGQDQLIRKTKQLCRQLSGGQKQSLAFFSAAAQTAQILCLDEFLSSIDHSTSLLLRQKAKEYAKTYDACVLIVSHDLDVALEDADAIVVFRNGRLVKQIARSSAEWNRSDLLRMVHA